MTDRCSRCNAPIEWRIAHKSGRRYSVNADGPHAGRFHSFDCPARPRREQAEATQIRLPEDRPTDNLAAVIAQHVATLIPASATLDEERVRAIVRETQVATVSVTVYQNGHAETRDVGRQHRLFPTLLHVMSRRRNLWLTGPAGSGKTRATHEAAKALNLSFGAISVGPQTTQSALFGYMDAHGNYVPTEFRRRYEQGGVFLFDEIDRGNPGVLTALNQAIENGTCAFPDAMVPRHPDFIAVAAANTYGNGASREYVGALQLDAATLDRFVMLAWDYDEQLERDLAMATYTQSGGTDPKPIGHWLDKVQTARRNAERLKIRHIVSPRASIVGADLLASGMDAETVTALVLWKGLDADTIGRLS